MRIEADSEEFSINLPNDWQMTVTVNDPIDENIRFYVRGHFLKAFSFEDFIGLVNEAE